jgi:hypothetical protein
MQPQDASAARGASKVPGFGQALLSGTLKDAVVCPPSIIRQNTFYVPHYGILFFPPSHGNASTLVQRCWAINKNGDRSAESGSLAG